MTIAEEGKKGILSLEMRRESWVFQGGEVRENQQADAKV
jgi:hypothetical protein